jgi:hypothetical protein
MSVVIVVVRIVGVINVIVNVINVMDFHGCPSNLHICLHPFVDAFQFLES